ncbi:MAG: M20/M25/M40 family metallo-hydrolase [Peptococcaceae bacterium]|nr:M20/M25/M40 family metallo-hydrolase [Peptococcaceae bacterium]
MVQEFISLVSIDSQPLKERQVADALLIIMQDMGLEAFEDGIAKQIGGDTGNIIAKVKGTLPKKPVVAFAAHLDRVSPGLGIKPQIRDEIIYSDGTTILAADDLAGVVQMLEAVRVLKEQNIPHGDVELLFTVSEESGMLGAKNLDRSLLKADVCYFLDGLGDVGAIINQAPSQDKLKIKITGRPAHAGLSPEKGISAIQVAAEAINNMNLGRIDGETTCNIGTIKGGLATNIVPELVEIMAEVRSRNEAKLQTQVKHMIDGFEAAAVKWGATADIAVHKSYPALNVAADDPAVLWALQAVRSIGITPRLEATGGGSDGNILAGKGLTSLVLSVGMEKVHSKDEYIKIEQLVKGAELLLAIIQQVATS